MIKVFTIYILFIASSAQAYFIQEVYHSLNEDCKAVPSQIFIKKAIIQVMRNSQCTDIFTSKIITECKMSCDDLKEIITKAKERSKGHIVGD